MKAILLLNLTIASALLILSACQPTEPPTPTPTSIPATATPVPPPTAAPLNHSGINFSGRLLVKRIPGIYEISINPSTLQVEETLIVPDVEHYAISPDNAYLVYFVKPDAIHLRDLRSGEDKIIVRTDNSIECFSWSPDSSKYVAGTERDLKVYDLTGEYRNLAYTAPSADYAPNGIGQAFPFYGLFDCGSWVSADSLIIQRASYMPADLDDMEIDTTSLIVLDSPPTLEDSPNRWYVAGVCASKGLVLLGDEDSNVFLASPFRDFKGIKAKALAIKLEGILPGLYTFLGFVPGSDCEIYYQSPPIQTYGQTGEIHFMNPETLQSDQTYSVATSPAPIYSSWHGVWVGDARSNVIAMIESEDVSTAAETLRRTAFIVVDLISGTRGVLTEVTQKYEPTILIWLP